MIEGIEIIGIVAGIAGVATLLMSHLYIVMYSKPPSYGNGGHRKYKKVL